jgi:hypothetical protein
VLRKAFPLTPPLIRQGLNYYFSPNYTTPARLRRLLKQSRFERFTVEPYVHPSGWQGTNLDCTLWASAVQEHDAIGSR